MNPRKPIPPFSLHKSASPRPQCRRSPSPSPPRQRGSIQANSSITCRSRHEVATLCWCAYGRVIVSSPCFILWMKRNHNGGTVLAWSRQRSDSSGRLPAWMFDPYVRAGICGRWRIARSQVRQSQGLDLRATHFSWPAQHCDASLDIARV